MLSKRGHVQHIEINVSNLSRSRDFYEDVLSWMGYKPILNEKDIAGWGNGNVMIFIVRCTEKFLGEGFHRKRVGLNHVGFFAESKDEVDRFHRELLRSKGVRVLYNSPRTFPQYGPNYYSVYFEDPDRIKLEFFTA